MIGCLVELALGVHDIEFAIITDAQTKPKGMSDTPFKIAGGYVYDPANGVDGQVKDIWIDGGKVVHPPADPSTRPTRTLNASGLIIMPGGVDMHCHIAGPKVNTARKMRPEEKRKADPVKRTAFTHSGTMGSVPSTFATGYKYIGLGYTFAANVSDVADLVGNIVGILAALALASACPGSAQTLVVSPLEESPSLDCPLELMASGNAFTNVFLLAIRGAAALRSGKRGVNRVTCSLKCCGAEEKSS